MVVLGAADKPVNLRNEMKDKILYQLGVSLILFFGLWFLLSQINYTKHVDFNRIGEENEKKLGDLIYNTITQGSDPVESDSVKLLIDRIKKRICLPNDIDPEKIRIEVVMKDEINAFALPGDRVVVFSGIIHKCKNPEELAGVLCHEIAHLENDHVMQKLTKEVGLSMLMVVAGGNSGQEILNETVRLVSSTAFDRKLEREADESAARYMANSEIDPEHFANLLFRFALEVADTPDQFRWISTHPDPKERASGVLKIRSEENLHTSELAGEEEWERVKKILDN